MPVVPLHEMSHDQRVLHLMYSQYAFKGLAKDDPQKKENELVKSLSKVKPEDINVKEKTIRIGNTTYELDDKGGTVHSRNSMGQQTLREMTGYEHAKINEKIQMAKIGLI